MREIHVTIEQVVQSTINLQVPDDWTPDEIRGLLSSRNWSLDPEIGQVHRTQLVGWDDGYSAFAAGPFEADHIDQQDFPVTEDGRLTAFNILWTVKGHDHGVNLVYACRVLDGGPNHPGIRVWDYDGDELEVDLHPIASTMTA